MSTLTKALLFSFLLLLVGASAVSTMQLRGDAQPKEEERAPGNEAAQTDTSLVKYIDLGEMRASWYGPGFHGRRTANGERYDMEALTAAHKTLKFGTLLRLTNPRNGESVIVRVNDRGPYVRNRQLDLSKAAAREVGIMQSGTGSLIVERIDVKDMAFPIVPFN